MLCFHDRRIPQLGATSMGYLGRRQKSQAAPDKKLKAYACELEQKLEARTRELAEALEQQTATTEILRIISTSPTDLRTVLEAVVKSAAHFCDADDVTIFELDGRNSVRSPTGVRFRKILVY